MILKITKALRPYIVNQQGELAHLAGDWYRFYEAYHCELQKTFDQVGMTEPQGNVLDIGSGLGAIDVVLMKFRGVHCTLVDGEDGDGDPHGKYDRPFCSRAAAEDFMCDNDVMPTQWNYCNPSQLVDDRAFPVFDVVMSFRSWCFHYPPKAYLWFVQKHAAAGSRIFLDVRNDRTWRKELSQLWDERVVLERHEKFERVLYVVKGRVQ